MYHPIYTYIIMILPLMPYRALLFFKIHYHLPNVTTLFVREIIDPILSWRANDAGQSRKMVIFSGTPHSMSKHTQEFMHSSSPKRKYTTQRGNPFSSHRHILLGLGGYHEAQEEGLAGRAADHRAAGRLGYHTTGCSRRVVRRLAEEDIAGAVQGVEHTGVAAAAVREAEGTIVDVREAGGTAAAGLAEEGIVDGHPASLHRSFAGAALPEERHIQAAAGLLVRHSSVDAR